MKKIISLMTFILIICCFYEISYATKTGTVYLESNQEIIEKGEEIEITVNLKEAKTAAFDFSLYFDNTKLEYISNIENTNIIENRIIFVWYDTTGGMGAKQGELVKLKFRAKENGTATFIINGEFYSETGQLIETNFEKEQIQIGKEESVLQLHAQQERGTDLVSNNAYLKALRLDIEGIIPSFDANIYEYYLTVGNDTKNLEVLAISENPNASIEVTGNNNLKEGLNTINIEVTSEDKTQKNTYKIEVTKTANIELANTNLEILAIENVLLNPPFDANETNYKAEVSNQAETINILAVPQNEEASVVITGKDNLKEGINLVTILVTAPNGFSKKKYQVEVYKRNNEEENKHNEEISEMQEKLEHAYEIEKTSSDNQENNKSERNIVVWIVILMIAIILILGAIWWYKKYNIKQM